MDIVQTFYDQLASHYDKLFQDWQAAARQQAQMLDKLFAAQGFDHSARMLDCACGIGTQAIGLAALGYQLTGSDISREALAQARERARQNSVAIPFVEADFRSLSQTFKAPFDLILCMDNALPHMLSQKDLAQAVHSIARQLAAGGLFVASIRDYDALLAAKPSYSPPYIHSTAGGQRVSFQTWAWHGRHYRLTQYIIEDEQALQVKKFVCEYRAVLRQELSSLLNAAGFTRVAWQLPEETGFYQPMVIARK